VRKILNYAVWIIPIILILMGFGLNGSNATSFLALICWCLAALVSVWYLLILLGKTHPDGARLLQRLLIAVLVIGITVVTVTGVVVAQASRGDADTDCDYIIVLGAKVNGTSPSRTLRERIDAAYAYLTAHPQTIAVVSGGKGSDEGISEALCMFNGLVDRGIDPARIWMEDQAASTWANLNLSLNLIEEKTGTRPTKIGLVSSEFHLYRATLFAKECGVESVGIPGKTGNFVHFTNYFLREIAGVWHYIILGGQYD
jgi:uncharacterized SAM-binding protein YcdF (DUF218 family)